jgi:hypothetical protein
MHYSYSCMHATSTIQHKILVPVPVLYIIYNTGNILSLVGWHSIGFHVKDVYVSFPFSFHLLPLIILISIFVTVSSIAFLALGLVHTSTSINNAICYEHEHMQLLLRYIITVRPKVGIITIISHLIYQLVGIRISVEVLK